MRYFHCPAMRSLTIFLLILVQRARGQIPPDVSYGTDGDHAGAAFATTNDGGWILAGSSGSLTDGTEMQLIKIDALGAVQWGYSHGSQFNDAAAAVRQTADGGFIACGHMVAADSMPCLALLRLDAHGAALWNRTYPHPGGASKGYDVVEADDGGFLAVGYAERRDTMDARVLKVHPDGSLQWEKRIDFNGYERGAKVLVLPDDGYTILVSDSWPSSSAESLHLVRLNAEGTTIWVATYDIGQAGEGNSLIRTSDGGYLITGGIGPIHRDVLMIRTDPEAQETWRRRHGTPYLDEVAFAAIELSNGDLLVSGSKQVSGDPGTHGSLARFDAQGFLLHERRFPQGQFSEMRAISMVDDTCWSAFGSSASMGGGTSWSVMRLLNICPSELLVEDARSPQSPPIGIHPNPASHAMRIHSPRAAFRRVQLWDSAGRIVLDAGFPETNLIELPLTGLAEGAYSVGIHASGGGIRMARLVISH